MYNKENKFTKLNLKANTNKNTKINQNSSVIISKTNGITLIALIVTIVVLIILATISINAVLGEDGLIKRAEMAREKQEIAQIKEEAELVKADSYIEYKQNKKTLTQTDLVKEINEYFEGSTVSGNTVTTADGKYDIIVDENLNITVQKHQGNNGGSAEDEPQVTIDISHTIETLDENTKIINLSYTVDVIEPEPEPEPEPETEESEVSTEIIEAKYKMVTILNGGQPLTEETIKVESTSNGVTYRERMLELILQALIQTEITTETREQLKMMAENSNMIYEGFLMYFIEAQYGLYFLPIETKVIEAKVEEILEGTITNEIKKEANDQAVLLGITYRELLLEIIAGMELTEEERASIKEQAASIGMSYEEYLLITAKQQGDISFAPSFSPVELEPEEPEEPEELIVTMEAWLGNEKVEIQDYQIGAKRNATYKVVVTTNKGGYKEVEIEVTGIVDEKFSEIYTASADYTDSLGNKAKIPEGFAVGVSEDINRIDKGLVITDSVDSEGVSNGNEYVWIPVSNINGNGSNKIKKSDGSEVEITLGRYTFDTTTGEPTKVQYGSEYEDEIELKTSSTNTYGYKELKDFRQSVDSSGVDGLNETAKDLAGFISSVEANGGFFIARYEASYESGSSVSDYKLASKVSTTATFSSTLTKGKLWNRIKQGDIAKVCKNMYTDNTNVESDLVNSYAWDTAIVFIQKCSNKTNYANEKDGNGKIRNTGLTGDLVCNVYDMSGNLFEWTTEYYTGVDSTDAYPCVYRRGVLRRY